MLVTDVGDQIDVGDRFNIEKIANVTKKVSNMMILPPKSEISHHHKVTYITMSPTSLSPLEIEGSISGSVVNGFHLIGTICQS